MVARTGGRSGPGAADAHRRRRARGTARLEHLARALEDAGNPGRWLHLSEAAERWPGLRFDGRVFFHPVAGRQHADHAVTALQESAVEHGATVRHETPVTGLTVHGDQHVEIRTRTGTVHARRAGRLVVAAGFSGHGFKFTPAIGRVPADLATTEDGPIPLFALPAR